MLISEGKIATANGLLAELAAVIPDDARFEAAVATANVSQSRLARYYLSALQREADGQAEPYYVPSDELTLEHVFPANPEGHWNHIAATTAKELLNKLGNQALLPPTANSVMGNIGFSEKKKVFAVSPFSLTKEIDQFSKWDAETISKRQESLARLAVKTWPRKPK